MITMLQIGGESPEAQDELSGTFRASSYVCEYVMCSHLVPLLASPYVCCFLFKQVGCVKASSVAVEHPRRALDDMICLFLGCCPSGFVMEVSLSMHISIVKTQLHACSLGLVGLKG